jgi:hypothetical protein
MAPLASDKNAPGNLFLYSCNKPDWTPKIHRSTNKGDTFSSIDQPNLPCTGEVNLKVNPVTANQLWLSTANADLQDRALRFSSDGGLNFNSISGISGVRQFGFGKAAPGRSNPTLFVIGIINGFEGLYKSDDATSLTANPTFVNISQGKGFGIATSITGNMNNYGQVFVGTSGRGVMHYNEQAPVQSTKLNIKTALQGPYNRSTDTMKTDLATKLVLPTKQPYSSIGYTGNETFDLVNVPNTVDWILIDIQDINRTSVLKQALLLRSDGQIVDTNNNLPTLPSSLTQTSYHIKLIHRNHLPISTNSPISLDSINGLVFDTTGNLNVKSSNQYLINPGKYTMKQGNANTDNAISVLDRNLVKKSADYLKTYSNVDLNMDAVVNVTDRQISKNAPDSL